MNYYSIGEVAAQLHVHQQTLRNWEKRGLIKPGRVGRTRAFSDVDVELCKKILQYSGRGISLKGIKELLELREETVLGKSPELKVKEKLPELNVDSSTPLEPGKSQRGNSGPEGETKNLRGE